jgi:predicted transcriptional regulator
MKKKFKKILISIKPEFADKILNGEKKFEYRTKLPKSDINYLLIY